MLKASLQSFLHSWWDQRHAPSEQLKLNHRNLYILPTRMGWMFGLTLLLLLVASINEQLNLGYILTFWLLGMLLVGIHFTHGNIRGLSLQISDPPSSAFAGQLLWVRFLVIKPRPKAALGVRLRWLHVENEANNPGFFADIASSEQILALGLTPNKRGPMALPQLRLETTYPLGAFVVWTWWRPAAQILVYPCPENPAPQWPMDALVSDTNPNSALRLNDASLRDQLRPYRRGDAIKDIAWKKSAQASPGETTGWFSREGVSSTAAPLVFTAEMTGLVQTEPMLSRLCAWLVRAESQGLQYGLRLAHRQVPTGAGQQHLHECLEVLALW